MTSFISQQQYLSIKCMQHCDENIIGICKAKNCNNDEKTFCSLCQQQNQHNACKTFLIENVPTIVKDHNALYEQAQEFISDLENIFLEKITLIKTILEGYQINEIFQCINQQEDLNSFAKIIQKLPKVVKNIQKSSDIIKEVLMSCNIPRIEKLGNPDLSIATLQRYQTTFLLNNLKTLIYQNVQDTQDTQETQINQNLEESNTGIEQNNNKKLEEPQNQGEQNLKSLNYIKAIEYFEIILKLEPLNIKAKVGLMNALKEMNYFNSSSLFQKKIVEQDPQNFDAILHQGVMLFNQEKYNQSIEYINSKLNNFSNPDQKKQLQILLMNNYLQNNQSQNARNLLNDIKKKYGESIDVFKGVAQCDLMDNQLENAENNLDKAIQLNNDDLENKIIQIQLWLKQHKYQNCLDLIENQLKRKMKNKDKENLMKLKPYIFYKLRQFQEAMVSCQKVLEYNLADIDTNLIFGKCSLENKLNLFAIHFFDKVLNQQRNHIDAQHGIRQAKKNLNQPNSQRPNQLNQLSESTLRNRKQNLSQVLDLQPNVLQNLLQEAATIIVKNNDSSTDLFIDKCIKEFPQNECLFILKASYYITNMSNTDIIQDYQTKAVNCLNNVLQLNPNNTEAKNLLEKINEMRPQTPFPKQFRPQSSQMFQIKRNQ